MLVRPFVLFNAPHHFYFRIFGHISNISIGCHKRVEENVVISFKHEIGVAAIIFEEIEKLVVFFDEVVMGFNKITLQNVFKDFKYRGHGSRYKRGRSIVFNCSFTFSTGGYKLRFVCL